MSHHRLSTNDVVHSRREFLARCGMGMGSLGLMSLLAQTESARADEISPLAPKKPHFKAKAKHVIHIFLNGGLSHVDSFDPKPALAKYEGKPLPGGTLKTERKTGNAFPSPFAFKKYGQSGIEVSDLFPQIGSCIDDIAVIRSMQADVPNHEPSLMLMNCGDAVMSRPSVGSWVTYGLGTENQNLPGFIALCPGGYPIKESDNWQSGFLPGVFQGTYIDPKHTDIQKLIENIRSGTTSLEAQRKQLDLLKEINGEHLQERNGDARLEARIQSFELAYRMQMEAADAFDVSKEPEHIRKMYGEGVHARQTMIARRLVERGVRFVQLWHGASQPWDNHDDINEHVKLAKECDQPIAALIKDLKQRGLLESTLILCTGEFGRTPVVEITGKNKGRDHNPYGFCSWLAGGGVKGGTVHGETDEFGFKAVKDVVHVHDLHATILHLLGFDHEKFTYRYAGRDFRLTDVHGHVVKPIIA
ncbi:MAG TPA: DUF1501 domain-containing protein [Planctomycetota bacterium]|nr:DUF1501 domain-containing protein [Planctomycetota bacterium]